MSERSEPIVVQMSNYNSPIIIETPAKSWVNYGEDNNYFGYILDRYRGSPTNHAIINGVAEAIVGGGITSQFAAKNPTGYAKAKMMFPDDDLSRWAFDLKAYGYYIQQIILTDDFDEIESVEYSPVQNWRSGKADADGNINTMWYSDDWTQANKKQFKPKPIPVYDPEQPIGLSVHVVKPYRSGSFYYPTVDYQGCLQYAHLEEEISNFHLNNIMNGLSPSMIINFNNDDPGQEKRDNMERAIKSKWGGSTNSGGLIVGFNDNKENAATIETVAVSDLDKQYTFLSEEATKKILVGHRITSPLFFGIRDSSGLGSNSDEIESAWQLFENTVLKGYRKLMIENMEYLLDQNGIHIPLEFITATPIEFNDTSLSLSKHNHSLLDQFVDLGETLDPNEWQLIDEGEVDYELENEIELNLTSTGTARPNSGSAQDSTIEDINYKVRYEYTGSTNPQREFCVKMMGSGKLYRKEDIIAMEQIAVNPGWGAKGADTYSIWLYKGGGNCYHKWVRKTFASTSGIDTKSPNAPTISTNKAEKQGYRVRNDKEVAMMPVDMPNKGFLPGNPKGRK